MNRWALFLVLGVVSALKAGPELSPHEHTLLVQQDVPSTDATKADETVQVAFDPLMPAHIIGSNLEITGKIYQSCTDGDFAARWIDRSSPKSVPNEHCYMVFLQERTWFQARRLCESFGGYLVTITSEDEMNFIWKKFSSHFTQTWHGPWIGFSDAAHEGDWAWVTGESAVIGQESVYANWYTNEPDDCCGGQDCASIAGGHWGYKWNDNKCHSLLPFICERDF
eukprot:c5136_g1_i1.p1 GENE.c5136_g1_i1~~c5136_g1_i1.p1  ORF type:complete len:224 (+),score=28.71 c5136_g1_i1:47-718(+)